MSDSDNYLKILEKISDLKAEVGVANNELGHIKDDIRDVKHRLGGIEKQDAEQNRLIDEHIQGVQTNTERLNEEIEFRKVEKELIQKQIKDLDERMKKAEFVPNLMSNLKTAAVWTAGLLAALGAIAKFFHWL